MSIQPNAAHAQPAVAAAPFAAGTPATTPAAAPTLPAPPSLRPPVLPLVPVAPPPMFDPKTELKGAVLIEALKQGGYILFMRHAQSTVGSDGAFNTTPNWWQNCAIQRNISDSGREQARKVGFAIRTLNIPLDDVKTSQFCRARDTAHAMGLGPVEITEDLNHSLGQRVGFDVNIARFKQLTTAPSRGNNTLLVSHTHGSQKNEERAMSAIQEAEIIVYRPDAKGNTEAIGKIPVADWNAHIPNLDAQLQAASTPK